ncbi:MAG: ABC-F family ATP-binding cassette domain-containing protein, partial [Pyrinomonadaceae bacterium]
ILIGLGFAKDTWQQPAARLSGGQKNRLGMVRLLLSSADLLLLDEPTNHLDVGAVEWLEEFLSDYDGAFIVISHDRYFLDRTAGRIVEIELGRAVMYKGNYSRFIAERAIRREQQQREYENQQAMISKTQEFIRKNLAGQKTKQAKSRRNMLGRLDRIEAVASEKSGGNFNLKKIERAGNNVLTIDNLSIGYKDKILARAINFSLLRGETLGIIGGNGTGKTTLLKTLMGSLAPLAGDIHWGTKISIGYYAQNLEELDPRNEIIQEMRRIAPLVDGGELRGFLARFLFFGEDIFKRVSDLSGGEKGRLALARVIYSQKNVLILDEPTNHLDIPSREALENALDEYPGTIVTVSHDRFFLDKIATQILAFESDGRVEPYAGNYTEYHDWKAARHLSVPPAAANRLAQPSIPEMQLQAPRRVLPGSPSEKETGRKTGVVGVGQILSKNQRHRLEKRLSEIEAEVFNLEEKVQALFQQMSQPQIAGDFARVRQINEEIEWSQTSIKTLYDEWDKLSSVDV